VGAVAGEVAAEEAAAANPTAQRLNAWCATGSASARWHRAVQCSGAHLWCRLTLAAP
jgi:hypothetical protein